MTAGANEGIRFFAMIHDFFGTHAGSSGQFFRIIREEFVRTYIEQDVLAVFASQVSDQLNNENLKKLSPIPLKDSLEVSGVKESLYAFA